MRDLVFFSMFVVLALMALRHVHLGMMLWVWSALLPPNDFLFGFAQGVPFNKIAVACTVIALFSDKRKNVSMDAVLAVLLAFFAQVSLAYAFSGTPAGFGEELYQRFVKVVIAAYFIRFTITDRTRLHSLLLVICLAVGTGAAMEGGKFLLSGGSHRAKGPEAWGDNNSTATVILMIMPIILYLRTYSQHKLLRYACVGLFATCALTVVGTFSRGGFIGLMVLFMFMVVGSKRRLPLLVGLSVMLVAGYAAAPEQWFNRIESTANAGQDASFMGRIVQWKILTLMAFDSPLFGQGLLANMHTPLWGPYAQRLTSELTFIPTPDPDYPHASHSIYFQVLGENGFLGLALYLGLFALVFRRANAIRRHARNHPDQAWAGDLATAIRLSLLVFLITGAALPIPYYEIAFVMVACLSALHWIQLGQPSPAKPGGRRPSVADDGVPARLRRRTGED